MLAWLRSLIRGGVANRTGITDPTGAYAGAAKPEYHNSAWRSLNLPYDWVLGVL